MTSATAIHDAVNEAKRDLDELRDRVRDLLDERARIEQEPVDREEAERMIRSLVDQARARGVLDQPLLFAADGVVSPYLARRISEDPLSAFAAVCPDQLVEAMLASHPGGGLSPDRRAARVAELERQLFAAECAEETCIRELESATGGMIARRLDAPASIILAPTEELEGGDEPEPADAGSTRRTS